MRGGAVAARRAHNPKVGGSNPPPATPEGPQAIQPAVFALIAVGARFRPGESNQKLVFGIRKEMAA